MGQMCLKSMVELAVSFSKSKYSSELELQTGFFLRISSPILKFCPGLSVPALQITGVCLCLCGVKLAFVCFYFKLLELRPSIGQVEPWEVSHPWEA